MTSPGAEAKPLKTGKTRTLYVLHPNGRLYLRCAEILSVGPLQLETMGPAVCVCVGGGGGGGGGGLCIFLRKYITCLLTIGEVEDKQEYIDTGLQHLSDKNTHSELQELCRLEEHQHQLAHQCSPNIIGIWEWGICG